MNVVFLPLKTIGEMFRVLVLVLDMMSQSALGRLFAGSIINCTVSLLESLDCLMCMGLA